MPGTQVAPVQEQPKHSNVFIRGLPLQLTEEGLSSMFGQFGTVQTCRLVIDLKTGVSRGYGFVKLQTVEQADSAITALNGSMLQDKTLEVRLADAEPTNKYTGQQPSNNLYIRCEEVQADHIHMLSSPGLGWAELKSYAQIHVEIAHSMQSARQRMAAGTACLVSSVSAGGLISEMHACVHAIYSLPE